MNINMLKTESKKPFVEAKVIYPVTFLLSSSRHSVCVSESVAGLSERCAVFVRHEEDLSNE